MHPNPTISDNDPSAPPEKAEQTSLPDPDQTAKARELLKSQGKRIEKNILLISMMIAAGTILMIVQYRLLAEAIVLSLTERASLDQLLPWLLPVLPLILCRAGISWRVDCLSAAAAASIRQGLRNALIHNLFRMGPLAARKTQSGAVAAALSSGVEALTPYFSHFLPAMRTAMLAPALILVVILPLDWLSGLIMLCIAPLIPAFMILIGKGAERLNQRQWRKLARMSAHFLEAAQNLTTLKLFNASKREAKLIGRISNDYRLATMSVLRIAFLSALALEFFATLGVAVVAVIIGFRLMWGEFDFTHGFYILLLAPELYLPLRSLGLHYHARMEGIGAATRMVDLISSPPSRQAPKIPATATHRLPPEILFDSVSLAYEDGVEGLKNASFSIPKGKMTALVGPSGGGKSSALSLLLGFVQPTAGRISIDGADLSDLDIDEWRKALSWTPQKPHLFSGSIGRNIALGDDRASLERIRAAAEKVGAWPFIEKLPAGLSHKIGEGGIGLSGGQIRLVALARAALRDAPFLMMDEPTASLDFETEGVASCAVRSLAENRTTLIVAHRLHTVQTADHIVVLDQGCAVESGTFAALLSQNGLFARMAQSGGFIEGGPA